MGTRGLKVHVPLYFLGYMQIPFHGLRVHALVYLVCMYSCTSSHGTCNLLIYREHVLVHLGYMYLWTSRRLRVRVL